MFSPTRYSRNVLPTNSTAFLLCRYVDLRHEAIIRDVADISANLLVSPIRAAPTRICRSGPMVLHHILPLLTARYLFSDSSRRYCACPLPVDRVGHFLSLLMPPPPAPAFYRSYSLSATLTESINMGSLLRHEILSSRRRASPIRVLRYPMLSSVRA